jgi:mannose-6-phosphate isomerase-like protein (cupin superfamily)
MIEQAIFDGVLYAVIVRRNFERPGIHFFTPNDFSQQLGHMSHPTGHRITPHIHKDVIRSVRRTEEVLVIRKGKLRVDFYDEGRNCVGSRVLEAGDVILLVQGGHGFEVLEDCDMIEIKQGPYAGDEDKERFDPRDGPASRRT